LLILTLVVIVTGGISSIRGAFYGALIVGIVDTVGRALPAPGCSNSSPRWHRPWARRSRRC
jgi:branched-subunit amino acid ABC-type transport system permease component